MFKKIVILCFIVLICLSSKIYAAGEKIPSSSFPVILGVTDDANRYSRYLRATNEGYLKVSLGTALNSGSDSIAVDFVSNATSNISTAVTTAVNNTNGALNSMVVNTGVSGTAAFYNIASAGCTGTPASGYAFTLSTTTAGIFDLHHNFTLGICVVTSGTANITVLYKDLP